ncbi:FGGY-family carbohydrate kinase [Phyllobacterium endophyticum]|uniref:Carbohydrate kinase n=1 Tax=Phyllobacterium endophyticum TaxID=1149773 RepID=A0A2P7AP78_9HYPH|nr:FGGY-family carbohydrate kinase [Phyllobacterium endophyticum]MBB3233636.1 sugar (pentulose or hexulose) kinase [Phyllobacterium endophyticum]PSH56004.1 carbohydrate kinase [Phyllobacterium endophyticum]TYR41152.1 carbohydrate kinase [Phyllobacterium endophyticum]
MSDNRRIAVIDVGKTNAKVVVVDAMTGAEIAARSMANRVIQNGLYPHYDIEALWAFFVDTLTIFAQSPGFDAISVTAHGAAAALLGDNDLAMPVIDYEHVYPGEVRAAYAALRPDFAETRSPLLSGGLNVGAQIHYQKTQFPAEFSAAKTIVTYAQYWVWRLTGVAANEVTSLGCHTDLWNPQEGKYSSLVDTLELRPLMAPIRSAFDRIGDLREPLASQIGVVKAIPVHCGIHDSNASLLPHLISRTSPFSVVSTGTWVVSFAVGGRLDQLDPARDTLANVDAYGKAVPSARFMGGREFDLLTGGSALEPDADTLNRVIRNQFMILPSVVQGSGPYPTLQSICLNDGSRSATDLNAAASLYTALMTDTCLELIGASGTTIVEGPFSRNRTYLSALRSLTGREVIALPGTTGTSLGAALLAGAQYPLNITTQDVAPLSGTFDIYVQSWRDNLARK